jgi:proteasome lid subunit RPN8/RPN11
MRLALSVTLPAALQDQIAREARAAFPGECCGLIEGLRSADHFQATRLHPSRNRSDANDRFALDAADHVAAQIAARINGHALIGCYHSHPNGKPEPSSRDHEGASEEGFLWLIAATDGEEYRLACFVYREPGFEDVPMSALGADLVTSSLKERSSPF